MGTYTGNAANGVVVTSTLPADNTPLKAADVNVPLELLLDNIAALNQGKVPNNIPAGMTITLAGLLEILSNGLLLVDQGGTLMVDTGAMFTLLGRRRLGGRVVLSDANHTLSVGTGYRFLLSSNPALIRTITLDSTTVVPAPNETIEILVPGPLATGKSYIVQRTNPITKIAEFWGNAAGDAGAWAEFECVNGVWRLGANCGGGSAGGVLAGPGA